MTGRHIQILSILIIMLIVPATGATGQTSSAPNYAQVGMGSVFPTTNTGGVQAGLGLQLTPTGSGAVLVIAQATGKSNTSSDGVSIQIDYGTGTPPANGVLQTGTLVGQYQTMISSTGHYEQAMCVTYIVTGLTLGTPYWFDLSQAAVYGGYAQLYDIQMVAVEL